VFNNFTDVKNCLGWVCISAEIEFNKDKLDESKVLAFLWQPFGEIEDF
jgi:hypothetical protein